MEENKNVNVKVEDYAHVEDSVKAVRYMGSQNIKEMMAKEQYIEAFTHAQMAIEFILVNRIIGAFSSDTSQQLVRKIIEQTRLNTRQIIKWSNILEVISEDEHKQVVSFNKGRNLIIHGHGKWWNASDYKESLHNGVSFIEANGM